MKLCTFGLVTATVLFLFESQCYSRPIQSRSNATQNFAQNPNFILNEFGIIQSRFSFIEFKLLRRHRHHSYDLGQFRFALISTCSISDNEILLEDVPELLLWVDFHQTSVQRGRKFFVLSSDPGTHVDMILQDTRIWAMAPRNGLVPTRLAFFESLKCPVAFAVLKVARSSSSHLWNLEVKLRNMNNMRLRAAENREVFEEMKETLHNIWFLDFNYTRGSPDSTKYNVSRT